jgi:hypothetical protein
MSIMTSGKLETKDYTLQVIECTMFRISALFWTKVKELFSGFGGLEVACWPSVPKFTGLHPAKAFGFLGQKKILSTPSVGGEVMPSVPCRSFTACKRSLNVKCKTAFRQNSRTFLAHSSTFRRWVLSRGDACRCLVMKVGTCNPDHTISLEVCSAYVGNNN